MHSSSRLITASIIQFIFGLVVTIVSIAIIWSGLGRVTVWGNVVTVGFMIMLASVIMNSYARNREKEYQDSQTQKQEE